MTSAKPTDFPLVFLIWGAGLGSAAQYGKVSVIFEDIAQLYPDAGASLGFTVSLVGFVGIVLGVTAGVLVGRIGFRAALIGGLLAGGLVSMYQASLPSLAMFLASRVVEGMSHLAIVVAAPTLISLISAERHRGFTLTLWGTFFGVAYTVLVWAGLPLVAGFGVPALFVAHGIYMIGFAGLLWARLRADAPGPPDPISLGGVLRRHLAIYRSPFISAPGIGWLFYTLSFVSTLTLLPPFIAPEWRVFVIGAMPLISIASSLILGVRLLTWFSPVAVMQMGFLGAALTALMLVAAPGQPTLCLVLAAALGLVQGAGFAAVPHLNAAPEDRAQANGALAQTGNIGNTLGTPLLLGIIAVAGHSGFMLTAAGLLAVGAASQAWLAMRRKRAALG
ncbi:MAG: MFS transporter [Pseudomonadota bacterium]